MKNNSELALFYVTCPDLKKAREISSILLQEKLIACAHLMASGESHYWWQGKIETTSEVFVLLKSRKDLKDKIESRLTQLHPYDVPCLLEIPVESGHEPYLRWLQSSLL